jgi:hypothetical protein
MTGESGPKKMDRGELGGFAGPQTARARQKVFLFIETRDWTCTFATLGDYQAWLDDSMQAEGLYFHPHFWTMS